MDLILSIFVLYKDFVDEYYFTTWITICLLLIFGLSVCIAVTTDNKESLYDYSDALGIVGVPALYCWLGGGLFYRSLLLY